MRPGEARWRHLPLHSEVPTLSATAPITQDLLTIPRRDTAPARPDLVGLTREAMRDALIAAGTPEAQAKMRVGQIWNWIYHKGARDFDAMTNLAKPYRALLAGHFEIARPEIVTRQVSADGTRKYLLQDRRRSTRSRRSTSPRPTAARSASRARSAAR